MGSPTRGPRARVGRPMGTTVRPRPSDGTRGSRVVVPQVLLPRVGYRLGTWREETRETIFSRRFFLSYYYYYPPIYVRAPRSDESLPPPPRSPPEEIKVTRKEFFFQQKFTRFSHRKYLPSEKMESTLRARFMYTEASSTVAVQIQSLIFLLGLAEI